MVLLVVALSTAGAPGGHDGRTHRRAVAVVGANVHYDASAATAVGVSLSNRRGVPASVRLTVAISTDAGVATTATAARKLPSGTTTVTVRLGDAVPMARLTGVTVRVVPAGTAGRAGARPPAEREPGT